MVPFSARGPSAGELSDMGLSGALSGSLRHSAGGERCIKSILWMTGRRSGTH